MGNLKLIFVRIKIFFYRLALSNLKYYIISLLLISAIVILFLPFRYWNVLPPCKEIEPTSFVIDFSKNDNANNLSLTINSMDKKTYICELSLDGLSRFYRDPLGNESVGYQYRVLATDINSRSLISFPIHVVPPVPREINPHNLMFNDICIGGHGIIEYMHDNFYFGERDLSKELNLGYVNTY